MRNLLKLSFSAALLLMAGCTGKVMQPHYYTLEMAPAMSSTVSGRQVAAAVAVSQFIAPPYLRQGRIVYRQSPEEVGFYDYQRWAVDPAETITAVMIQSLRSRELFSIVKRYDGRNTQDYLLTGRIERLEELDYEGPVRVKAEISAELLNLRTGSTEWTGEATATFNVEKSSVDSVVAQMNHAVQDCVEQLAASLAAKMDRPLAAK
jgi:uncharacterized lipoprotein YmbA